MVFAMSTTAGNLQPAPAPPIWNVAAFYCFSSVPDVRVLRELALEKAKALQIIGSLLIAPEGINGTMAGRGPSVHDMMDWLRLSCGFAEMSLKFSQTDVRPFGKLKVRLKREIVAMGAPGIVTPQTVGNYVEPSDWNELIHSPGVVVVDTRNHFEIEYGRFENAVDPQTRHFRQFPQWAKDNETLKSAKSIAMYCTGGIRCEKATAHLRSLGYQNVFHLKGGILQYLKEIPPEKSAWQGKCFVFDEREAVGAKDEHSAQKLF